MRYIIKCECVVTVGVLREMMHRGSVVQCCVKIRRPMIIRVCHSFLSPITAVDFLYSQIR